MVNFVQIIVAATKLAKAMLSHRKNHKDYGEKDTPKENAHLFGCKAEAIHGAKKRRRNEETMA